MSKTDVRMCRLERLFPKLGFVLLHDGSKSPKDFILPPEEVAFFTRKYRLKIDGKFVNTWATFRYDGRKGSYAEFELYSKDPDTRGREKLLMSEEPATKEV